VTTGNSIRIEKLYLDCCIMASFARRTEPNALWHRSRDYCKPAAADRPEKWMYLAFRNEIRFLIAWELKYDYYWMDHVLQMMTGCDPETLTMKIEDEDEDKKDDAIERLIKRQKYDKAFDVATGSSFFCF
jgi:hypothetical protein